MMITVKIFLTRRCLRLTPVGAAASLVITMSAHAQTFLPTSGTQNYNTAANWTPATVPNAIGASATFNSPTALETVNTSAATIVGTVNLTNNGTFVFTLANGSSGSLAFQVSSGNAAFNVSGTGTAVNILSAPASLTSTLDFTINDTAVTSSTGALQITGALTGAGGLIKDGDGTMSFATNAKTYAGSTVINSGILRTSTAGEATMTSGVAINSGGTLSLAAGSTGQTIQFGTSTTTAITLNGAGTTKLQGNTVSAIGALTTTGNATTLSNNIVLASDSTVSPTVALTLSGNVSGNGALIAGGTNTLILTGTNTYSGATAVNAGMLLVNGANSGAGAVSVNNSGTLLGGTGSIAGAVTVNSGSNITAATNGTIGTLTLQSGLAFVGTSGSLAAYLADISAGTADRLTITGNLDLSGAFDRIAFSVGTAPSAASYTLLSYTGSLTGTFNSVTGLPAGYALQYNTGEIDLVAVPEPTTVAAGLLALGTLGWSQRRRVRGFLDIRRQLPLSMAA